MSRKMTVWKRTGIGAGMGVFDFAKSTDTKGLLEMHELALNLVNTKAADAKSAARARKILNRINRHLRERGFKPTEPGHRRVLEVSP